MKERKMRSPEASPRSWLTPTVAAQVLGISTERVRQLRLQGILRGELMPNGRYVIYRADVERRMRPMMI